MAEVNGNDPATGYTSAKGEHPEDAFKRYLAGMEWHMRPEAVYRVTAGFCIHCGYDEPEGAYCQCTNDE